MKIQDLEGEIWKLVPGFEKIYDVSNLWRVKSLERIVFSKKHGFQKVSEKLRKLFKDKNGYLHVALSKDGVTRNFAVHRLVAMAFLQNPENHPHVLHIDDNRDKHGPEHLKWGDSRINKADAIRNGKVSDWKGENNPNFGKSLSGENNPNFGKHHSPETLQKLREAALNRDKSQIYTRKVRQIDLKTGEVIKIWDSITEASLNFPGKSCRASISSVCKKYSRNGKWPAKSAVGFGWEYNET